MQRHESETTSHNWAECELPTIHPKSDIRLPVCRPRAVGLVRKNLEARPISSAAHVSMPAGMRSKSRTDTDEEARARYRGLATEVESGEQQQEGTVHPGIQTA